MSIEDAFLHDILAHPDDDAPRLIYADWLDEHNDPRGEFIRIQCALAQLSDEDPRRWPLEQREQELLREHETKWLPKDIGNASCIFRRGFVEQASLILQEYLTVADRLFEQAPLRYLHLRERSYTPQEDPAWEEIRLKHLAHSPHLARLKGLRLRFLREHEDLRSLIESPYLEDLTELGLSGFQLDDEDEDVRIAWERVIRRPMLRRLDLGGSRISPPMLRALAESTHLTNLCSLNLSHMGLSIDDLRILVDSSSLPSLTELNLNRNRLTHEVISVLGRSALLAQLETLCLDANTLGDSGAMAIRDWPSLPRMKRPTLRHNQIFAAGVQALAGAPALCQLVSLDLFGNISCDAGAVALASSDWKCLQALNLRFNGVGDKGVRALAHSETLSQLTRLNLTANCITYTGARSLIESSRLPRLARLDLLRNDIGEAEQRRLRDRFGPFVYC